MDRSLELHVMATLFPKSRHGIFKIGFIFIVDAAIKPHLVLGLEMILNCKGCPCRNYLHASYVHRTCVMIFPPPFSDKFS